MATSGPRRIRAPDPPKDLSERKLPVGALPQKTWVRLHDRRFRVPLHWSRAGMFRFDSAHAPFGLFYCAGNLTTAFLEIFGDKIRTSRRLALSAIERYDIYSITPAANLKILALEGANLVRIGATVGCFPGSHPLSQRWGAALMAHSDTIDGLVYVGRRSGAQCLALFGRDADPKKHQASLEVSRTHRLDETVEFWQLAEDLALAVY